MVKAEKSHLKSEPSFGLICTLQRCCVIIVMRYALMPYKGTVNHLWAQFGTERGIFLLLQQDSSYLRLCYFRAVFMRSMDH